MLDRTAIARHLVHETQLRQQQERELLPTGIAAFDQELGGLPRGAVTEIWGSATSGKTTFFTSFLARATASGEYCSLVDASDSFDPAAACRAGADLGRLLWVRCRNVEQALKAADLLAHAGGWGVIVMDLAGVASPVVRRIPMSWWYRFRRAVEHTPTSFLVI
jgi:RecA/RadA recombinase